MPLVNKRYVVQDADTALPWQKFHRIYDQYTGDVIVESDNREKLERIARALEREHLTNSPK